MPTNISLEQAEEDELRTGRKMAFVARRHGERLGSLTTRRIHKSLVFIESLTVNHEEDYQRIGRLLLANAKERLAGQTVEAKVRQASENAAFMALLEGNGFHLHHEKVYVARKLRKFESAHEIRLSFTTLAEEGKEIFVAALKRIFEDDVSRDIDRENPLGDFEGMIEYAGSAFDPTMWKLAKEGAETVGLMLAQRHCWNTSEGSMFYFGIVPEYRGKRLAVPLHAEGLRLLCENGVTDYRDSTDIHNLAMQRVFAANGCKEIGKWSFYEFKG